MSERFAVNGTRLDDGALAIVGQEIYEAIRTLEGSARYDKQQGSSRSSQLTLQRRVEVVNLIAKRLVDMRDKNSRLTDTILRAHSILTRGKHDPEWYTDFRNYMLLDEARYVMRLLFDLTVPTSTASLPIKARRR